MLLIIPRYPHPFRRLRGPGLILSLCVFGACAGCGPEAEVRQYVVEPERETIITSDRLRDEFGAIPFVWEAPKDWVVAPNDQFSKVAWQVGDTVDRARITVSDVSMGMGLVSQLNRWRGQVGLEAPDNPMEGTDQLKLGEISATYVSLEGSDQSILGMMFPYEGKLWVFKFRGSNNVADAYQKRFKEFCESVRVAG